MCPTVPGFGRKGHKMKLRVRYDNSIQTIDLDEAATQELWVSLSLEGEELTQGEREKLIQDAWEERFNRPDYNSWHKFDRHRGNSKKQMGKTEDEEDIDTFEPMMNEVADVSIFYKDEIERSRYESYEAICQWVQDILQKKPKWANAFIAVRLNGVTVNDHAAHIGVSDPSIVSKWLARAEKKLRDQYPNRQI